MCGRYLLHSDIGVLIQRYGILKGWVEDGWQSEIFPSQPAPVVVNRKFKELYPLKWGFAPSYAKRLIINARVETVDKKHTFKRSFAERRCIVPANAFFEWKKEGGTSIKYEFHLKKQPIFSLAGIYDIFTDKAGKRYTAFAILTTKANPLVAQIHNRMPVILPADKEDLWLDEGVQDLAELRDCIGPFDKDLMDMEEV
ncbi:MAG TPA: SOS response-associated peptidase [Bacillota bacterium]|nr:SOS response-associated peptidase [Bacillota bacterium]